jgi:hypothetical protein
MQAIDRDSIQVHALIASLADQSQPIASSAPSILGCVAELLLPAVGTGSDELFTLTGSFA